MFRFTLSEVMGRWCTLHDLFLPCKPLGEILSTEVAEVGLLRFYNVKHPNNEAS